MMREVQRAKCIGFPPLTPSNKVAYPLSPPGRRSEAVPM